MQQRCEERLAAARQAAQPDHRPRPRCGERPQRRQRRDAQQRPHHARLVEAEQLVDDVPLDLAELVGGQAAQARATGRRRSLTQVNLGDVQGRVVVVVAVGVNVAAGDEEPRPVGRPAGGGRHPPDRGFAQRDDRLPQDVGTQLEVGAGKGRAVDGGAQPAVAGELAGGHLDRPLLAAVTDRQPQPALLMVLVADEDVLEDPQVEVGDLRRRHRRVDPVELGVAGVIDDAELGRGRGAARAGAGAATGDEASSSSRCSTSAPNAVASASARSSFSRTCSMKPRALAGLRQVDGVNGDDGTTGLVTRRDLVLPLADPGELQRDGADDNGFVAGRIRMRARGDRIVARLLDRIRPSRSSRRSAGQGD